MLYEVVVFLIFVVHNEVFYLKPSVLVRSSVASPPGDTPRGFSLEDANCKAALLRPAVLDLLIECIAITGRGTARTAKHERPCLGQRKEQLLDQAHRPLVI